MEFRWFIFVGLIAGWLAGAIMRKKGSGLFEDIITGVLGALIGGYIFRHFDISAGGGLSGSIITATIGAIVLIASLRLLRRV